MALSIISTTLERARAPISLTAPKLLRLQSQGEAAFWPITAPAAMHKCQRSHAAGVGRRTIQAPLWLLLRRPVRAADGQNQRSWMPEMAGHGLEWLDVAAQLAGVMPEAGRTATNDLGRDECRQSQPNRSDSASFWVSLGPNGAAAFDLSLSRFARVVPQCDGSVRKPPCRLA
ncbi:hypothetical protein AOQ84DRAFT_367119 [Glonium stellatum]|uniref:Uncharacterized protein n=1 Tax=Glonium stellatum TaxID=574774 RepID=A0A8E2JPM7_9PEZI|nr:hypothetical protein AOQ84DRAFT_367119 [Glonium stellatum]